MSEGFLTRLRHSRPIGLLRYHLYRDVTLAWPRRHACNICGWRGRRFLTYYHSFSLCPRCGSQDRHRLIAASLDERLLGPETPIDGGRVLHVSPEHCLGLVLKRRAREYVRADFGNMESDLRQDLTRMPFRDGTFDAVVACDVLEHIPDDRAALSECRRVLRPGGLAVLTVPQSDAGDATHEDPSVTTPELRRACYGQEDHVRNYGEDFGGRVAAARFSVTRVDASAFNPDLVRQAVLQPAPKPAPWGWNRRRVYFGKAE